MPLPIVHFAVAVRMHELKGIAPDAIHVRPNTGHDDKLRVHLRGADNSNHERVRALLVQHWTAGTEATGFAEGYAAHLLTDRLWVETVVEPLRESSPFKNLSAQEARSLYYRETDQIDFNLYHHVPWRATVWARLAAAQPRDFAPLLTAEETRTSSTAG